MTSSYVFSVSVSVAVAVSGSVDWQCTVIASSGIPPSLSLSLPFFLPPLVYLLQLPMMEKLKLTPCHVRLDNELTV